MKPVTQAVLAVVERDIGRCQSELFGSRHVFGAIVRSRNDTSQVTRLVVCAARRALCGRTRELTRRYSIFEHALGFANDPALTKRRVSGGHDDETPAGLRRWN